MAEPVKVRRLTDEEGRRLQRLVRRGEGKGQASVVRYRRALVILASAGQSTVSVIARLLHHKTCGVRQYHGCYSYGDDTVWAWSASTEREELAGRDQALPGGSTRRGHDLHRDPA